MSLLRRNLPIPTWGAEPGPRDSTTKKEEEFDLKKQTEQRGIPIFDIGLEHGHPAQAQVAFNTSPSPPVR